jgi:hypothetical protein
MGTAASVSHQMQRACVMDFTCISQAFTRTAGRFHTVRPSANHRR